VVVATPGRLVDLLLNASDFGLEDVEMLVLDEADRLLDMGFIDQITEIVVNHCISEKNTTRICVASFFCCFSGPRKRQTLLFSATMTEDVNKLAALSLQRPSRVAMPSADRIVAGLRQVSEIVVNV
jgi:ATP-dependent RNA helicase DDX27